VRRQFKGFSQCPLVLPLYDAEGLKVDEYTIGLIKGAVALLRKLVDMDEPPSEITREGAQAVADQLQDYVDDQDRKTND
jgi:hypothetical protein